MLTLWNGPHGPLDERDPVGERARGHVHQPEAEVAVGLLVDPFEGERVGEADPPGGGGLDEALVPDEEHMRRMAVFPAPGVPVRM